MSDYDNNMRGVLFPRQRKEGDHPNAPHYRGSIIIDNVEYELSGWKRTSKKGDPYLSILAKLKEERRDGFSGGNSAPRQDKPAPPAKKVFEDDEDIPF